MEATAEINKASLIITASCIELSFEDIAQIKETLLDKGLGSVKIKMVSYNRKKNYSVDLTTIMSICSRVFDVKEYDIRGKSRKRKVVFARHAYHTIADEFSFHSLSEIGLLSGKNHATVLNSKRQTQNFIDTNDMAYVESYMKVKEEVIKRIYEERDKVVNTVNN